MSKATTKATIDANIKQNGVQAITGPVLNSVLNTMVDDYGAQEELTSLGSEVGGLKINLKGVSNSERYPGSIDSAGYISSTGNSQYILIRVNGGETLVINRQDCSNWAALAFITEIPSPGSQVSFADGESSRRPLSMTTNAFNGTIPNDAKFVLVNVVQNNTELGLGEYYLNGVNITLSIRDYVDNKTNGFDEELQKLNTKVEGANSLARHAGAIDSAGRISSTNHSKYILIPVNGGENLVIDRQNCPYGNAIAFITDYPVEGEVVPFAEGQSSRISTPAVTNAFNGTIPNDAKFVLVNVVQNNAELGLGNIYIDGNIVTIGLSEIKNEYAKDLSVNVRWKLMHDINDVVSKRYGGHYIDAIGSMINRFAYGDVHLSQSFVVPNIGSNVVISVTDNPDYYISNDKYSANTAKMFVPDIQICVGTKDTYDVYTIVSVNGNALTCRLDVNGCDFIGGTMNPSVSNTKGTSSAEWNVQVFRRDDILAYESQETPRTSTFDTVHPIQSVYSMIGRIMADRIKMAYGIPSKVYAFGDSWTNGASGWSGIAEVFTSCQCVNKGVDGDMVEHIVDRFETFMETYTPQEGDVFMFLMGTNNFGLAINTTTEEKKIFYKSQMSIFLDACERISSLLPTGNWFVAVGHNSSSILK